MNELKNNSSDAKTFVHSSTRLCATKSLCIPCHYKIFPTGTYCSVALPPNQRPEQCPRAKKASYDGLYQPHHRLLTLGDGDFSFSLSIAKSVKFTSGCLIATSHESKEQLLSTYSAVGIKDILKDLEKRNISTLHCVDATDIARTSAIEKDYYDAIIWNFPCVRAENGADGQLSEIEINRKLLRDFFSNVHLHLRPHTGQLHITHKTFEPFSWWEIVKLAEESGFEHDCSVVFDRCLYPGYINRKVLDKKSFPLHDARTFVFTPKRSNTEEEKAEDEKLLGISPVVSTGGTYAVHPDLLQMSSEQAKKEFLISVKKISGQKANVGMSNETRKAEVVADSSFSATLKKRKKGSNEPTDKKQKKMKYK